MRKKRACYILITCEKPAVDGSMQVEMSYEGDAALASYLLNGAQSFMAGQMTEPPQQTQIISLEPYLC